MKAFFLIFCCLFSAMAAADPEAVTVIMRARHRNEVPEANPSSQAARVDALPMQFNEFNLGQLGTVLKSAESVLPREAPKVLSFYFTYGRSEEEQRETIARALIEVHKQYPDADPKIEVRYLNNPLLDLRAKMREEIKAVAADDDTLKVDEVLLAEEEAWKAAAREVPLRSTPWQVATKPGTVRWLRGANAAMHGILMLVPRVGQVLQGPQGALNLASGIGLAIVDSAYQTYCNYYTWEMSKWLRDHGLYGAKRFKWIDRLNRYYTSELANKVKGTIYGTVSPMLGTALRQTALHFAHPETVALPGWPAMVNTGLKGIVGAAANAWGGEHLDNLRQKGWISQGTIDMMVRALSYFLIPTAILDSSGQPELYGLSWLIYMIPTLAILAAVPLDYLLPPRRDRLVIIQRGLETGAFRADIDQIEATEAATVYRPEDLPEKLKEIENYTRLGPSRWQRLQTGTGNLARCLFGGLNPPRAN